MDKVEKIFHEMKQIIKKEVWTAKQTRKNGKSMGSDDRFLIYGGGIENQDV